jgi:hypothetical protein
MTPKELRAAAEVVKCSAIHSSGWIGIAQSANTLADHILATVREDEGDDADPNWQIDVTAHCGFIDYFQTFLYQCWSGGHGKTRGQFRKLCEGLGIELKENDQ